MPYCSMHLTEYGLGTMCPECRREQAHETQQELVELQRATQREAESHREALVDSIREAEYKRFNPGDYQCNACKLTTLLDGASRCPVCHADVGPEYWPSVRARERRAKEATAAEKQRIEDARKRACDVAAAIVTLGTKHTQELFDAAFQEATLKREAQGTFARLFARLPVPSKQYKIHFHQTTGEVIPGGHRWIEQPILIVGIVTLDTGFKIGFKHYRFSTPHEFIAAFRYLKKEYPVLSGELDQAIATYQPVLGRDWPIGGSGYPVGDCAAQDYGVTLQSCRDGAARGDAASQYEFGRLHANGHGVPQNYEEALKWYRKAAAQGHAGAQRNIGIMYARGQAVSQDYAEALGWYRKAADQGDAAATRNIGFMYANGQAVSQDYAEALRCYRQAADQGDAWAARNIGQMYHRGQGVVQDYKYALAWYGKAASQDDPEARLDAQFNIDLIGGKFDR